MRRCAGQIALSAACSQLVSRPCLSLTRLDSRSQQALAHLEGEKTESSAALRCAGRVHRLDDAKGDAKCLPNPCLTSPSSRHESRGFRPSSCLEKCRGASL